LIGDELDVLAAESSFSGVVRIDRGDEVVAEKAYGFANRALEIPNETATRFGVASGAKGLTALAVVSLVEDGTLELTTTARSVLGDDLPLIDDAVTVEHLLAHRSGIGDYLDEDLPGEITDYVMPIPLHELATTEDFLAVLDGFEPKFRPDEAFSYCNGGFVVLALIAERASRPGWRTRSSSARTSFLAERRSATSPQTASARTSSTCPCAGRATEVSTRQRRTCDGSGRRSTPARSSGRSG
jgi:CubicO group peptidase (beta-lactamase class C family)